MSIEQCLEEAIARDRIGECDNARELATEAAARIMASLGYIVDYNYVRNAQLVALEINGNEEVCQSVNMDSPESCFFDVLKTIRNNG
jgi:hypothetical protein